MTEFPEPLTPADCDLRDFGFMPLQIGRLQKSKQWLIAKREPEIGFYALNLWAACWHEVPAASLEDDDDVLCDAAMCDPKRWPKVKEKALRGFVKCSDGRLYHRIVAEKALSSWESKKRQRNQTSAARDAASRKREQKLMAASTVADTEDDTEYRTVDVSDNVTMSVTDIVTETKGSKGKGREVKGDSNSVDRDFETFWKAYPNRGEHPNPKKPARLKFTAALERGVPAETIIAGAERYRRHCEAEGTAAKFIAQAMTWINQERWGDAGLPLAPDPSSPEQTPDGYEPDRHRLKAQILTFRAGGWQDFWGPKPGEKGCLWPKAIQDEELTRRQPGAAA